VRRIGWIVLVSVFAFACKKDEINVNTSASHSFLHGKLKSIQIYKSTTMLLIDEYNFYYDSVPGRIGKMTHTRNGSSHIDSVKISRVNDHVIALACYYYSELYYYPFFYLYAYENSNNYITAISYGFPDTNDPYKFTFSPNGQINNIRLPDVTLPPIFNNSKEEYNNIQWDGNNYIGVAEMWEVEYGDPLPHTESGIDTVRFTYSSFLNNGFVPDQQLYYFGRWSYDGTVDPVYLLNIFGYYAYKPNKNLLDKKISLGSGYEMQYYYTFNDEGQIIEYTNTDRLTLYKLSYYE
jgi:hypothetical protein